MILVDTNVLIYAVNRAAPQHRRVFAWWEAALNGNEPIGLAWVATLGFLRVSTNRKANPQSISSDEAIAQIDEWLSYPNLRLVLETPDHWAVLRELVRETGMSGNRTTDAHLAALAISHNATLASCDTDFGRFRRLRWVNPAAVG